MAFEGWVYAASGDAVPYFPGPGLDIATYSTMPQEKVVSFGLPASGKFTSVTV
jgi:hypothetical protein